MITINHETKLIRVHVDPRHDEFAAYFAFTKICDTWMRSPYCPGDPPLAFCWSDKRILLRRGYTLLLHKSEVLQLEVESVAGEPSNVTPLYQPGGYTSFGSYLDIPKFLRRCPDHE